jgi:hypothetical protein
MSNTKPMFLKYDICHAGSNRIESFATRAEVRNALRAQYGNYKASPETMVGCIETAQPMKSVISNDGAIVATVSWFEDPYRYSWLSYPQSA